jgi:hypothetical protein
VIGIAVGVAAGVAFVIIIALTATLATILVYRRRRRQFFLRASSDSHGQGYIVSQRQPSFLETSATIAFSDLEIGNEIGKGKERTHVTPRCFWDSACWQVEKRRLRHQGDDW